MYVRARARVCVNVFPFPRGGGGFPVVIDAVVHLLGSACCFKVQVILMN